MAHENGNGERKAWTESFRVITPILLILVNAMGGMIIANQQDIKLRISELDTKIFKHLTNDELHTPRSMVVSQQAFTIYQTMRDKQMDNINENIHEIKIMMGKNMTRK